MTRGIRRGAAEWRLLIQEWQKSGQEREAFAAARGVKATTLGWWISEIARRDRLAPKGENSAGPKPTAFLPVRVMGGKASRALASMNTTAAARDDERVEIALSAGRVLRVHVGADAMWIARLAAALEGVQC